MGCAIEPSFDCSKASHDAEELICRDNELAELDNQLAGVYHAAVENIPADELKTMRAMQRGWIKGRNDCWKADDLRDCVKLEYETRITELQIRGGLVTVPEPVEFQCDGGKNDYLTAVFYQSTVQPATAPINKKIKMFISFFLFVIFVLIFRYTSIYHPSIQALPHSL